MTHRVPFIVTELGADAGPLCSTSTRHWARKERKQIAAHTRAALAELKARGVKLGGPNLAEAREASRAVVAANASRHADNVMPIIRAVQKAGAGTLQEIADALNACGVQTARGGLWHPTSVKRVMERSAA